MARNFLTAVNLNKNELQNPQVHNLAAAPSSPVKGQLYMNTSDNTLYWHDGTTWQSAKAGSGFPGYGAVPAETTFGISKNDGVATTVARSDHTHGSPVHSAAEHSTISLSALAMPTADLAIGGFKLSNVGAPTTGNNAATKAYVDSVVAGLSWHQPVEAASTANQSLTGGVATIDGVSLAVNDRVLLKNQTAPAENGIYQVNASPWTRVGDLDVDTEFPSAAVFVKRGTTQADTAWTCTNDLPITLGTTAITWAQFAGTGASVPPTRQVIAGAGLTNGGALSADVTLDVVSVDGSITVGANSISTAFAGTGSATTSARSDHTHAGMARKFAAVCAAATSTVVNHALNTRDVIVNVYRTATPWDTVETDVERTDTNNVTVRFATAPTASEYTIVVVG